MNKHRINWEAVVQGLKAWVAEQRRIRAQQQADFEFDPATLGR